MTLFRKRMRSAIEAISLLRRFFQEAARLVVAIACFVSVLLALKGIRLF